LRNFHGVALCDKVQNCKLRKVLNVERFSELTIEIPATVIRPCVQNAPRMIDDASRGKEFSDTLGTSPKCYTSDQH